MYQVARYYALPDQGRQPWVSHHLGRTIQVGEAERVMCTVIPAWEPRHLSRPATAGQQGSRQRGCRIWDRTPCGRTERESREAAATLPWDSPACVAGGQSGFAGSLLRCEIGQADTFTFHFERTGWRAVCAQPLPNWSFSSRIEAVALRSLAKAGLVQRRGFPLSKDPCRSD